MLSAWRHFDFRRRAKRRFASFERSASDPRTAFAQLWRETYQQLREQSFWQARSLAENIDENPTTDYDDYRPALEASFAGTVSPLNGEPIEAWAVSSGSSGPPKKFPITETYKNQMHDFHVQFFYNYLRRYPSFLKKPLFYMAGHGPAYHSPSGIPVGYISNYNFLNMPRLIQNFYGTPIAILKDLDTVLKWRPFYVLAQDASAFMAATPAVVVALLKQIELRGPELYEYLSGQRPIPSDLPPVKVSPARLRQLEAAGLKTGKVDFAQVWPGMVFAGCWTDAVCKLQAIELRRLLGPKIPVVEMPFSATEAWATIPLSAEKPGGAIHCGSLLVEFGTVGVKNPKHLLKPWELVEGEEYELYVTNRMGLVRYRMFDIVKCSGYYRNVAQISFQRKSSQEISLGEACISETELIHAVAGIDELRGKRVFFSPSENGRGLTLFVESQAVPAEIGARIYDGICRQNPAYEKEVELGALDKVDVRAVDPMHRIWQLSHAQAKPYLIHHVRPELG